MKTSKIDMNNLKLQELVELGCLTHVCKEFRWSVKDFRRNLYPEYKLQLERLGFVDTKLRSRQNPHVIAFLVKMMQFGLDIEKPKTDKELGLVS